MIYTFLRVLLITKLYLDSRVLLQEKKKKYRAKPVHRYFTIVVICGTNNQLGSWTVFTSGPPTQGRLFIRFNKPKKHTSQFLNLSKRNTFYASFTWAYWTHMPMRWAASRMHRCASWVFEDGSLHGSIYQSAHVNEALKRKNVAHVVKNGCYQWNLVWSYGCVL